MSSHHAQTDKRKRTHSLLMLCFFLTSACQGAMGPIAKTLGEATLGAIIADISGKVFKPFLDRVFQPLMIGLDENEKSVASAKLERVLNERVREHLRITGGGNFHFQCTFGEKESACEYRATQELQHAIDKYLDEYEDQMAATSNSCRDRIVLSPNTGRLGYPEQVQLITDCMANSGYQTEVFAIRTAQTTEFNGRHGQPD